MKLDQKQNNGFFQMKLANDTRSLNINMKKSKQETISTTFAVRHTQYAIYKYYYIN